MKTWRYHLPSQGMEGYAVVFIDSAGVFSAVSDYGSYGHVWSHHGCRDIREFIMDLYKDPDYAAKKLNDCRPAVYDGEATEKHIRRMILEYRREMSWTKNQAREEWELLDGCNNVFYRSDFDDWYQHTRFDCANEFAVHRMNSQVMAFCTKVLPRLSQVLRDELMAERYFNAR